MKKTLAIVAIAAMATVSAMAQGTLLFATFGGGNNYQIWLPGTTTPAAATDGVLADLLYGTVAAGAAGITNDLGLAVQIQGNGIFTPSAQGNQNPAVLPTIDTPGSALVIMRAWKGAATYALAASTGRAQSGIFTVGPLGGGIVLPPNIPFGVDHLLLIVPEPSTIALAVLGLGGLLLIRRRK